MNWQVPAIFTICLSVLGSTTADAGPQTTAQNVVVTNTSTSPVPVTAPSPLQVSAPNALPVVVNSTTTNPVHVAVVHGPSSPQAANGNGLHSLTNTKSGRLELYYNNTGRPVVLTSITVRAYRLCDDGGPPIWASFGVTASDGASQAHIAAAYQFAGPIDQSCLYIATAPGSIVVPAGQSLSVSSVINLTTNAVQISAGFSGHTLD